MEGSRLPNRLILGPFIICILIIRVLLNVYRIFVKNLGTKVEKKNGT